MFRNGGFYLYDKFKLALNAFGYLASIETVLFC